MAYDRLEPFGAAHADLRSGVQTAHLISALVGTSGETFRPRDFMPVSYEDVGTTVGDDNGGWERPRKPVAVMKAVVEAAIRAAEKKKEAKT